MMIGPQTRRFCSSVDKRSRQAENWIDDGGIHLLERSLRLAAAWRRSPPRSNGPRRSEVHHVSGRNSGQVRDFRSSTVPGRGATCRGAEQSCAVCQPRGGTGVNGPAAGVSPAQLAFSFRHVGTTSSPQWVTLTNTGNASLTFTGFTIAGNYPSDFAISSNTCNGSLAADPPKPCCGSSQCHCSGFPHSRPEEAEDTSQKTGDRSPKLEVRRSDLGVRMGNGRDTKERNRNVIWNE